MATAVFFLLVAIWMQELALMGVRSAGLVGVLLLVVAAAVLHGYHQSLRRERTPAATALAALGRVAASRRGATPRSVRTLSPQR